GVATSKLGTCCAPFTVFTQAAVEAGGQSLVESTCRCTFLEIVVGEIADTTTHQRMECYLARAAFAPGIEAGIRFAGSHAVDAEIARLIERQRGEDVVALLLHVGLEVVVEAAALDGGVECGVSQSLGGAVQGKTGCTIHCVQVEAMGDLVLVGAAA